MFVLEMPLTFQIMQFLGKWETETGWRGMFLYDD
jgi:hypothetical protein